MKVKPYLYDVTATDDTQIRRVIYSEVNWDTAVSQKDELLYNSKKRWKNPRIRKHKPD